MKNIFKSNANHTFKRAVTLCFFSFVFFKKIFPELKACIA